MTSEHPRYTAAAGHQRPSVSRLNEILDRYDRRDAAPHPVEADKRGEREQFELDYSAFREDGLRGALEEVAWQLERRGHHAWVEDVDVEDAPATVDAEPAQKSPLRPLVFRALPAHSDVERPAAPVLRFVPHPDVCQVQVEAVYGDPRGANPVLVSVPMPIEALAEPIIIEVASEFLREVLLGGEGVGAPDDEAAATEEERPADRAFDGSETQTPVRETAPREGRGWSDTNIARRWLEQQRTGRSKR